MAGAAAPSPEGAAPPGGWTALALLLLPCACLWFVTDRWPAELPVWLPTEFSPPIFLCCAASLLFYMAGYRAAPAAQRPRMVNRILFVAGILLVYGVTETHFLYAEQHMFFFTRIQHLVLHHLAPFLVALADPTPVLARGLPPGWRRTLRLLRPERMLHILQQPLLASVLFVGLIWLWLIPPLHLWVMVSPVLYALMNWSMALDGFLFWFLVFDRSPLARGRLSLAVRILLLFAVQLPQIVLGGGIMILHRDLYPYYALCGRLYPLVTASLDQEIGGALICYGGGMMSVAGIVVMLQWLWAEEGAGAPLAGAGTGPA